MLAFGNKHFAPEGESVILVDSETGLQADPVLVDRVSGKVMVSPAFKPAPGPAARRSVRRIYAPGTGVVADPKPAFEEELP
jgi:hypothetical protein